MEVLKQGVVAAVLRVVSVNVHQVRDGCLLVSAAGSRRFDGDLTHALSKPYRPTLTRPLIALNALCPLVRQSVRVGPHSSTQNVVRAII